MEEVECKTEEKPKKKRKRSAIAHNFR